VVSPWQYPWLPGGVDGKFKAAVGGYPQAFFTSG